MLFDLGRIPLDYIAEGKVPLKTEDNVPMTLLTDGSASELAHKRYTLLMGQTIQLINVRDHPDLVQPYLFVIESVRLKLSQEPANLTEHIAYVLRVIDEVTRDLQQKFPSLFQNP